MAVARLTVVALLFAAAGMGRADVSALAGVVQVAAGAFHSCALTASGNVLCWGRNDYGQLGDGSTDEARIATSVTGLGGGVTAIAAGRDHTCAILAAGALRCWGANYFGTLGIGDAPEALTPVDVPGLASGVTAIAAGDEHTCAVVGASGAVKCWGSNGAGQLGDGTTVRSRVPVEVAGLGGSAVAVAAGGYHTCALLAGGALKCWGGNFYGQLGDGTLTSRPSPAGVVGLSTGVLAIAAGTSHTCAVTSAGPVKCWGSNERGQLADGTTGNRVVPVTALPVDPGVPIALTAGEAHTCVVNSFGMLLCSGANSWGQLGTGNRMDDRFLRYVPGLASGVSRVSAGYGHTCAVVDGGARCWGSNVLGQVGNGVRVNFVTPVEPIGLAPGVLTVAAGSGWTCAVEAAGSAKCWGGNYSGQLGVGTLDEALTPAGVVGLASGTSAIAPTRVLGSHTCAIAAGGAAKCWGNNTSGQLGNGSRTRSLVPVSVTGLGSGTLAISSGQDHTCAVATDGGARCWGSNFGGQLGNGTTIDQLVPTAVTGLGSGVVAVGAGWRRSCALTNAGAVKCWGDGWLGDGTMAGSSTPVDVAGLSSGVTAIAVGFLHTCALTASGTVKCWGDNRSGELGDGTTASASTPADVIGLGGAAIAISAGGDWSSFSGAHTCALLASGIAKCWGANIYGQLGDYTRPPSRGPVPVPVTVLGLPPGVTGISAGNGHTCALANGSVRCWGSNYNGQLGVGTAADFLVPQTVLASSACARFGDVSFGSPFCSSVEWMRNHLVTLGCTPELYCPGNDVTRLAMAAFMQRLGTALTPVTLWAQQSPGALDLDGGAVVCQTGDLVVNGYQRQALVDFVFAGAATFDVDLQTEAVASFDSGTSWSSPAPTSSVTAVPANHWAAVKGTKVVDLSVGPSVRFGIRVSRLSGSITDLAASDCAVRALVVDRNRATPPF